MFKAAFIAATNTHGEMLKITETKRYEGDKTHTKFFPYNYSFNNTRDQALAILERNGVKVIGRAEDINYYVFFCERTDDSVKIKDLK